MRKPTAPAECVELIDQALFELEERVRAAEYDDDEASPSYGFPGPIETEPKWVRMQIIEGHHRPSGKDLACIARLNTVNLTSRTGLDA